MNFFISLKAHAINRIALKVKLTQKKKKSLRLYYSSNAHLDKYARTMQKNLIVPFGNTNSTQCAIVFALDMFVPVPMYRINYVAMTHCAKSIHLKSINAFFRISLSF